MAAGYVQVPADSTGKKVDCVSLSAGGNTVVRQTVVIADPTSSAGFVNVVGGAMKVTGTIDKISAAVAVTVAATLGVTGTVALAAGTANIGTIDGISKGVVLAAGTAHVGEVNISTMPAVNISAMPNVTIGSIPNVNVSAMPAVSLAAGATLDGISKTVVVNVTNAVAISGTVAVAGSFTVGGQTGNASATVGSTFTLVGGTDGSLGRVAATDAAGHFIVTGTVALAAGVQNIGTINNISATVLVAGSFTVGGQTGNASATVGSTFTMVGGMDGSLGRVALTDAAGHFVITGTVALAGGASNIGTIDGISKTVAVSIASTLGVTGTVALAAGSANIGTINNISATVAISGTIDKISAAVVLAAGTANIGTINNISAGVVLAAGTANIGTLNNISAAVVLGAGSANIGSINNISAPVALAAGSNNIGSINNISATVVVQSSYPRAVPSASHGPKTVSLSSSATTALIAAPGAALHAYVTQMLVTNGSPTLTQLQIYEASATGSPVIAPYLAASGGGYVVNFDPPWEVSANTALNARLKPSVGGVVTVTLNFTVGS